MLLRMLLLVAMGFIWQSPLRAETAPPQKWEINGVAREGLVFAPESARTEAAPLVFAFHGHGGTMRFAANKFKIHELWPEAIVIYPQGLNTPGKLTDPSGLKSGWQPKVGDQDDRDLKLFDAMLKWAHETYKVDDKRIYCTGHSNGGGFTFTLWAARSDVFAAVAPACAVAAASLKDLKPKPALHIAGTQDPLVKFEWQKLTIDTLRKLDGCEPEGKPDGDHLTLYPSPTGTPVETYIYEGGHAPPPEAWPAVVKFFKDHPGK